MNMTKKEALEYILEEGYKIKSDGRFIDFTMKFDDEEDFCLSVDLFYGTLYSQHYDIYLKDLRAIMVLVDDEYKDEPGINGEKFVEDMNLLVPGSTKYEQTDVL